MSVSDMWAGARRMLPMGGQAPSSAVLLLHGLGSNADDLIELAPDLMALGLQNTVFVSPNAPFPYDLAPSFGNQWFSLHESWTPDSLWQGVTAAAPLVERMVADVLREFALPMNKLALVGFSQGTMMALHCAPRLNEPLAAVVGFSGALVAPEKLPAEVVSRPPVLLVHGQMDPVVPYAALPTSAAALRMCGFTVDTETRPRLQHGIDAAGIEKAAAFLVNHFDT